VFEIRTPTYKMQYSLPIELINWFFNFDDLGYIRLEIYKKTSLPFLSNIFWFKLIQFLFCEGFIQIVYQNNNIIIVIIQYIL